MTHFRTLASIIEEYGGIIQTGPFGSQLHEHDYVQDGIGVVMPKDIKNGRIAPGSVAKITEEKAASLSRHKLKKGEIVFPRRGDIGKCAFVTANDEGYLCGTGCIKISVSENVLLSKFLFYYLGLRHVVEWLERNAVGTTMLNLNTSIIGGVQVPMISVREQRAILSILESYDDLIENNRRRIELLEQSARLLYKEWFVYFRFLGHEHVKIVDGVPEGWNYKPLEQVAPLQYGKALKAENRVYGPNPVYGSSGIVGYHVIPLIKGPAIIVGRKGNVGSVFWSSSDCYPIDTVYFIDGSKSSLFLYYSLLNIHFISTDVAVPGLNRDFAHSRLILVPDEKIVAEFHYMVDTIHAQINILEQYNVKLAQARDLLLPRLMNGEVAI